MRLFLVAPILIALLAPTYAQSSGGRAMPPTLEEQVRQQTAMIIALQKEVAELRQRLNTENHELHHSAEDSAK